MKIYILGICGTFMAGIALLARELGHDVVGSDANVYPPMSTQLEQAGIKLYDGYTETNLEDADLYVVGNAISRGNPQIEAILNRNLRHISGPQWLYEHLLKDRWVLAVAGTHGKTTTSSMLAWILEYAGLKPGFLIGGLTQNFNCSARLGESPFFVIEADEYDTAFFDKRSKFVHYHPRTLVMNNLEFDHADIFDNLEAIKTQFHHLVRIVPGQAQIIFHQSDPNLHEVLNQGCWSEKRSFGFTDADLNYCREDNSLFDTGRNRHYPEAFNLTGDFNRLNASAAVLAAQHAGVPIEAGLEALQHFSGVKRRQEIISDIGGITVYDDFAHHPTAIKLTLQALREKCPGRLFAVFEPRSNTMKLGVHRETLMQAFEDADQVAIFDNQKLNWDIHDSFKANDRQSVQVYQQVESIIANILEQAASGDSIVIMSNGGFDGIHEKLKQALNKRY